MNIFDRLESQVRSYCRAFPVVFDRAVGSHLYDVDGNAYIDFFCGAGTLSYGHNNPLLKRVLIDYLQQDGVVHALDMATAAKGRLLTELEALILAPRGLNYRVQFTGPTGANAVEAALKLARKVKRRRNVIAFTRAYHGLSMGALSVTANAHYRDENFLQRGDVTFMPFDGYFGEGVDTAAYLRRLLEDESSGLDRPAAIILETVQAEGGVHVASVEWLRAIAALCRELDIALIVDDIQVGCGRTGTFFSFERAGIEPDIIVLSKAISGFGLPMSLLLVRPSLDRWKPGEHTGTFRGNNAAFVTAAAALRGYWHTPELAERIRESSALIRRRLIALQQQFPEAGFSVRGSGMIQGLSAPDPALQDRIARACFARGLIIETCGRQQTLKILPALTTPADVLSEGLDIIEDSVRSVLAGQEREAAVRTRLSFNSSSTAIAR
jgi:diaminobutyrate-2-oxoglutarate transaminase